MQSITNTDTCPFTVEQLIPDEMQMRLMAIGQSWRTQRWEIGQLVHTLRCHIEEKGLPIAVMSVYTKVSNLLGNEVTPRTVRYWADVFAFYPEEIRVKYSEVAHYHYGIAKAYAHHAETALMLVARYIQTYGHGPGEGWLEIEMTKLLQNQPYISQEPPVLSEYKAEMDSIHWQDLPMIQGPAHSVRPLLTALHDIGVGLATWLHGRKLKKANRLLAELTQILAEIDK